MSQLKLVEAEVETLTVRSDLLGELNVPSSEALHFPTGMLGFPECRRFVLVRARHDGLFWLQSVEYSTLAFPAKAGNKLTGANNRSGNTVCQVTRRTPLCS